MDALLAQQRTVDTLEPVDACGLFFWQSCSLATQTPPAWPAAPTASAALRSLHASLNEGAYSTALYGAPHRLPPLREWGVLWLRLLDNATLRRLPRACSCQSAPERDKPFYYPLSALHSPADAFFLHRWVEGRAAAVPDHGWAEVRAALAHPRTRLACSRLAR